MTTLTTIAPLAASDLLTGAELSRAELEMVLHTALDAKHDVAPYSGALAGKSVVMLFEKPSLRTRVSFEVGVFRLGGQAIYLDHQHTKIGAREPIRDYGKNLERWTHAIVARVDDHATLDALAAESSIPVVNALSDTLHPCQALADFLTLKERFGALEGLRIAYLGDGNNVCHSLMLTGAALGAHVTVISPTGYGPDERFVAQAQRIGARNGSVIAVTDDVGAVEGHEAVYTDTWTSMGDHDDPNRRANDLAPYRVTRAVMNAAAKGATEKPVFMHCLPAHRGEEVDADVIDSPCSVVYDQAENRMHAQIAVLLHLVTARS